MKQMVSMGLPGAGSANWMCRLPADCTPNVRPSVHAAMSTSPLVSAVPGSALLVQNLVMYGLISRRRLMTGDGSLRLPPSSRLISRSEEHTSELQSPYDLVCRLLLEQKNIHRAHAEAATAVFMAMWSSPAVAGASG